MKIRYAVGAFLTILGMFTLVACGTSSAQSSSPTPTPVSAQDVLNSASQRFDQVNSLHFQLQVGGNVALDQNGTIKLHGATGDLLRPNSAKAKADVTFLGANLSIDMVSIGTDQYITNPVSGSWEKAPSDLGYDPAVLFDKNKGISHILKNMQNPAIVGSDTVDGQPSYHMTGTVSKADAQPIAGGALNNSDLKVDFWITKKTNDLVKLVLHDTGGSNGGTPNTWTLLLTQQNESVTINKPNV